MPPSRLALQSLLEHSGISLDGRQLDQLWAYHGLLRSANAELNLTRIHNFENMVLKHYVDSMIILKFAELPTPLIDMGSGPGLPGIPLKIARPEVEMILAEPRGARAEFLEHVVKELGLTGIEVHAGKITPRYQRPVAGVITRAVATIGETLDRVAGCLATGGKMLFMKGPDCDTEIAEAVVSHGDAFRLISDQAYTLPHSTHHRRLVVYERLEGTGPRESELVHAGPVREISSVTNPSFQELLDLLGGRGIRKQGRALVAGRKIVPEVAAAHPGRVQGWITDTKSPAPPIVESAPEGLVWYRLAPELFRQLDVSGTHAPLLLVEAPRLPTFSNSDPWPTGCTLFVPFQDPENVGAVLRSAAAFGVTRVVLLRESAHPFHPKALRAGGPAAFQLRLETGPPFADLSSSDTVPILALSGEGQPIESTQWPARFGLVAGVEGPGLPTSLAAGLRLRIPIEPGVESLNAATAVAVALYAWRSSRP